jgi:hypothetical protein
MIKPGMSLDAAGLRWADLTARVARAQEATGTTSAAYKATLTRVRAAIVPLYVAERGSVKGFDAWLETQARRPLPPKPKKRRPGAKVGVWSGKKRPFHTLVGGQAPKWMAKGYAHERGQIVTNRRIEKVDEEMTQGAAARLAALASKLPGPGLKSKERIA